MKHRSRKKKVFRKKTVRKPLFICTTYEEFFEVLNSFCQELNNKQLKPIDLHKIKTCLKSETIMENFTRKYLINFDCNSKTVNERGELNHYINTQTILILIFYLLFEGQTLTSIDALHLPLVSDDTSKCLDCWENQSSFITYIFRHLSRNT